MKKNSITTPKFHFFLLSLISAALLGAGVSTPAREAGWVPYSPPAKNSSRVARPAPGKSALPATQKKMPDTAKIKPEATVYDNQQPLNGIEVEAFLELLPRFRAWARNNGEEAHPTLNDKGMPDFLYSQKAARWVSDHNFEARRFFCVMGKLAAALVIVEEGNDFKGARPRDMPAVTADELNLARRYLREILKAGTPPRE